ncbi:MAG TPA: glycosyltransferase [Myxococcota bacterium]|nr:glycosyltransferase [Myxococcota bacterium]HRY94339.1 glycosyltransferase [Myxococcota bacterium]HSA21220.1 glycosyltransferase [Myxococcota bacterium]
MLRTLYLVSYYFAPLGRADGVNRALLARGLVRRGWRVEVVQCENPSAPLRSFQRDPSLLELLPDDVRRHPIRGWPWGPVGGLLQLAGLARDPFGNWAGPALKAARELVRRERGWVVAIVPPATNLRVAFELARETGLPLALDFRDNVRGLPAAWVQACRAVFASTPRSLADMLARYRLPPARGRVVYNGYDEERGAVRRADPPGGLRVVYTGLLNLDQDPACLARALAQGHRPPAGGPRVRVDYYGPENYYTRWLLPRHLSAEVRFHGYLPYQAALAEVAAADLGLVSLRPAGNAYRIPSKAIQYLGAGTPLLAVGPDGALRDLVAGERLGLFCRHGQPRALVEALEALAADPRELQAMRARVDAARARFASGAQAGAFADHLDARLAARD